VLFDRGGSQLAGPAIQELMTACMHSSARIRQQQHDLDFVPSASSFLPQAVDVLCSCCRSSRTDILTIMGAEFLATIFIGCLNACLVQPVAYVERTVFYRERAAGTPPPAAGCISTADQPKAPPIGVLQPRPSRLLRSSRGYLWNGPLLSSCQGSC